MLNMIKNLEKQIDLLREETHEHLQLIKGLGQFAEMQLEINQEVSRLVKVLRVALKTSTTVEI